MTTLELEMLAVIMAQHEAIDRLFAHLIEAKPGFYPSQSGQPWTACLLGNAVIEKATALVTKESPAPAPVRAAEQVAR